eukprot:11337-Heterococcus_DN1.PRE.1
MKQRVRTTPINSGSTASRPTNSNRHSSSSSSSSYDSSSSSSGGSLKFRPRPCVPVVPNVQAYGACIQAYAIARKHLQAIQVLREMQQRGVQPNAVCYGAAINACTRNGEYVCALEPYSSLLLEQSASRPLNGRHSDRAAAHCTPTFAVRVLCFFI